MIPYLDLNSINKRYQGQFAEAFEKFMERGQMILGDSLSGFEKDYAQYCGTQYCIGVGNGLDALRLIFEGYKTFCFSKKRPRIDISCLRIDFKFGDPWKSKIKKLEVSLNTKNHQIQSFCQ